MAGSRSRRVRTWRDDVGTGRRPRRVTTIGQQVRWRRLMNQRLPRQVIVALTLGLMAVLLAHLPFGYGERIRGGLGWVTTRETDFSRVSAAATDLWQRRGQAVARVREIMVVGGRAAVPADGAPAVQDGSPAAWVWPVQGEVVQSFGWHDGGEGLERQFAPGIEIAALAGEPVRAAADGRVVAVSVAGDAGYRTVVVDHGGGWTTRYGGCDVVYVQPGDTVDQGALLAALAPDADGLHRLYMEMELDGLPVDPEPKLRRAEDGL